MEKEIWKDVKGYEGFYMVSNFGNVKSIDRTVFDFKKNRTMKIKGTLMKCSVHQNGYIRIPLSKNGKKKYFYVHNLVMLAFVGEKPNGHDVDHKDSNRKNNYLNNLRYLTFKKNRGILGNNHASPNYKKQE